MDWEAWVTVGVVTLTAVGLARNWAGPEVILLGNLTLLMTLSGLSDQFPAPKQLVAGFANHAIVAIGSLYVVAEALRQTGVMTLITQPLLGKPKTILSAQLRLTLPVAALSGFLNNTPIVAMFMPLVSDWCKENNLSPSKLFIPLSYAAIMGGVCTLIGTATNLVIYDRVIQAQAQQQLSADIQIGMFTIALLGLPVTVVGLLYIYLLSPKLLPDRVGVRKAVEEAREYTVEMLVEPGSAIDGKTIEQAGLRHLPNSYLAAIEREGETIVGPSPEQKLRGGDRAVFVGVVDAVVDLQKRRGLAPATDQVHKLQEPRPNRRLVEAVVSGACPIVGKTIREGRFRTRYDGVVIAVHRGGEDLRDKKIGDIVLQAGDTLLLETHPRFIENNRNRRDFFLISAVSGSNPLRHDKAYTALGVLLTMVLVVQFGWLTLMNAALLAGGLMVFLKCCSKADAMEAVDWRVLIVIGSAIGLGVCLEHTGAAQAIADGLLAIFKPSGPWGVLLAVALMTMLFTETIGHVAAAVLVFPIALAAAAAAGPDGTPVSFMPFVMVMMICASSSFATPTGYQTNLMVWGAGGYQYMDYVRFGLPLNLVVMVVAVGLAPIIWPF